MDIEPVCQKLKTYDALLQSKKLNRGQRSLVLLAISDFLFGVAEEASKEHTVLREEEMAALQDEVAKAAEGSGK